MENSNAEGVFPFRIGDFFGYADMAGNLHYFQKTHFNVALSESVFINYSRVPSNLVIQNSSGEFIQSLPGSGYPLLDRTGDRFFIISSDCSGLRRITTDNVELWRVEFASLITCLALTDRDMILGMLDGSVKIIDENGSTSRDLRPSGSRVPIVLGCAADPIRGSVAGVFGIDPQQLFLWNGDDSEIVYSELPTDFRREVFVRFSVDGEYIFVEGESELLLWDTSGKSMTAVPLSGGFIMMDESEKAGKAIVLSEKNSGLELTLINLQGNSIYSEVVQANTGYLKLIDDHLFVCTDSHLMRIDLLEE